MTAEDRGPDVASGADRPTGELGGHPVNADELAPKEHLPDPPKGGNKQPRDPDAIEDEPGQDL